MSPFGEVCDRTRPIQRRARQQGRSATDRAEQVLIAIRDRSWPVNFGKRSRPNSIAGRSGPILRHSKAISEQAHQFLARVTSSKSALSTSVNSTRCLRCYTFLSNLLPRLDLAVFRLSERGTFRRAQRCATLNTWLKEVQADKLL